MECSNYKRSYLDYLSQNLSANGISKSILERLAKSFYDIFSKYFNDSRFLETLDWEEVREMDYPYLEFALSIKESEMAKLLQQNEVFTFKLASKVQDEEKCCLLELEYSPLGEEALKVVSLIAEPLKLSSLLENKKGKKKENSNYLNFLLPARRGAGNYWSGWKTRRPEPGAGAVQPASAHAETGVRRRFSKAEAGGRFYRASDAPDVGDGEAV